ncbi:DMT family transporter [Streptomyces sp. CWNU-52B]|uniref:DMT family transporter n=1 Tax=unclassified Streptomyces TaxID=2593676 RepID=UPI0039C159B3
MLTRLPLSAALVPRGTALLVLAGLLWGTGGLAGSLLASRTGMHPVAVAALRLLIGGIFITIYAATAGGFRTVPRTRAAAARLSVTGLLMATYQTAYFAAVQATSVSLATLTTMVAIPVLVTIGSAVLDRRLPTLRAAASIVTAVSGLMLLLNSPTSTGGNHIAGAGLALLAALGFALLTLDRRAPLPGLDPNAATGLGFMTGGLLLLPAGLLSGMELPPRIDVVGAVMFLGLVPTAVAYTSYFTGLRHAGAAAGIIAILLEPLTATQLAVLIAHDHLDGLQVLGAFLVLVAIGVQQAPTKTASRS